MSWFTNFLTSSIGRKLVMSLTGLFLIVFLLVHLLGNLQLLSNDGGESFNVYAKFMTTNPLIKTTSFLLYAGFVLHIIQGFLLVAKNRAARGSRYKVKNTRAVNTSAAASSNMGPLGIIILIFLIVHLVQFKMKMVMGSVADVTYGGVTMHDLYTEVAAVYTNIAFVIFYIVAMAAVGFHLWHGFQSAFQTLGLNHKKYSPFIQTVGKIYAVVVPLLFAIIPLLMYLNK